MELEKRVIPSIKKGRYSVHTCSVCSIDDIIGTNESLCTYYFSDPNVDYDYGYDYIIVKTDDYISGYYIGVDRFCQTESGIGKEYVLYEYAIFEERGNANNLLYSHLQKLSNVTGCSRIICNKNGGNSLFYKYFANKGFTQKEECLILSLPNAKLSLYDKLVIPTKADALKFEELFFLREQGFRLDEEKCLFEKNGESISIDRKTGVCSFSRSIQVVGKEQFVLKGQRALCKIDVLCQLIMIGGWENIKIYLPSAKETDTTPDILADDSGVFIQDSILTIDEERELRAKLRKEGALKKYELYKFSYNYEVGGRRIVLGFNRL